MVEVNGAYNHGRYKKKKGGWGVGRGGGWVEGGGGQCLMSNVKVFVTQHFVIAGRLAGHDTLHRSIYYSCGSKRKERKSKRRRDGRGCSWDPREKNKCVYIRDDQPKIFLGKYECV